MFRLDKLEGADIKYNSIIFRFHPKTTKSGIHARIFIFAPNIATRNI